MIRIRKAAERGHSQHGWLDSRHSFSFDEYHDPQYMGHSVLRVINEDRVAKAAGFPTHGHRDMEIISYVLEGALEHKDSMGNGSVIRPGDVQRMSAGTGVTHSEFNASSEQSVHFLQIWIRPDRSGYPPGYGQKHFTAQERDGRLRLLVSPDGREGSIAVHQDACMYGALLNPDQDLQHRFGQGRKGYVQVAKGRVKLDGEVLEAGDGAFVEDQEVVSLQGQGQSEVLLFDLP